MLLLQEADRVGVHRVASQNHRALEQHTVVLFDPRIDGVPRHTRHLEVEKDNVIDIRLQLAQCFVPVPRDVDVMFFCDEELRKKLENGNGSLLEPD